MNDRELIKSAMRLARELDLGRSEHYADVIFRLVQRFEELEELTPDKEPTSIVWEPKKGDEYFYVATTEYLNSNIWVGSDYELALLKHHNVYKTRELAEKAAKYQERYNRVLQAVLNLEPDQKVDWSNDRQIKYEVHFGYIHGLWKAGRCYTIDSGYPVLTDKKNLQPLLDYLNLKGGE